MLSGRKQRVRVSAVLSIVYKSLAGRDWVLTQTRELRARELEAEEREYEKRLEEARKREITMRKVASSRVHKRPVCVVYFFCDMLLTSYARK